VVRYEGGAVPVVDFRKRLELPDPVREETRLIVLNLEDQRVAVVVDEVLEVMRVDSTTITPPSPIVRGLAASYIAGIITRGNRTIVLLHVLRLLTATERLALVAEGS
jgi:purine-binding chemotaxis protein CheW